MVNWRRRAFGCATAAMGSIVVVAACSSFEDAGAPASRDDAMAPEDSGPTTDSSTTGDATVGCVPEPSGPTDAGVEDARCDPSGLEVNLSLSNEHCGFCGHVCALNNACAEGACTGQELSTADESVHVGRAYTATHLYWASNVGGCSGSKVRSTELGKPGGEEVLVEPVTGCIGNVAISDGHLYYLQSGIGIRRTPIGAPAASSAPLPGSQLVSGFTTTSSALFAVDFTFAKVTRMQHDGGAPTVVHNDPQTLVRTLGADETSVWWTTEEENADAGASTLWGVPPSSDTVVKRAEQLTLVRNFTLDAEYIYLASATGEVVRVAKTGASPFEPVTTISAEKTFPRGIAVVGDYLYVAVGGAVTYGPVEIYRAKKCGGRARLVARDVTQGNEMFAAGNAIYYSGGIRLRGFVPKP